MRSLGGVRSEDCFRVFWERGFFSHGLFDFSGCLGILVFSFFSFFFSFAAWEIDVLMIMN